MSITYHYVSLRINRQKYTNGPLNNTRFFMGPVSLRIINCKKYHYFWIAINATLFAVWSINKSGIIDTQFCLPGKQSDVPSSCIGIIVEADTTAEIRQARAIIDWFGR